MTFRGPGDGYTHWVFGTTHGLSTRLAFTPTPRMKNKTLNTTLEYYNFIEGLPTFTQQKVFLNDKPPSIRSCLYYERALLSQTNLMTKYESERRCGIGNLRRLNLYLACYVAS